MDWTKIKRSFWGVLRVQLYAAGVGGAIAYASFVHAYDVAQHDFGELAFDMLSGLGGLARGVERVELNGQTFTFAATALADAPEQVIADFEERCASGSGSLSGDLAGVVAEAREHGYALPNGGDASRWFTRSERSRDRDSAHASCFVRSDGQSGALWNALERFASTGQLGALGRFRYVRVDREPDARVSRVLAIASDGELDIDALLPESGDARGNDPRLAPRPPQAVRQLSARIPRSGQGAYVYSSAQNEAEILAHYDRALHERGLRSVALPAAERGARAYAAGDGAVIVSVTQEQGESRVAVFELGSMPR